MNYKLTRKRYEIITIVCNIEINRIPWLMGTISPYPIVQCVVKEKYNASRLERYGAENCDLKCSGVPHIQYINAKPIMNNRFIVRNCIFLSLNFRMDNKDTKASIIITIYKYDL